MFSAFKERRFVKQTVRRLLKSYAAISAENKALTGRALYREVLLHTEQLDPSRADRILQQAEDSVDQWTAGAGEELGFRQVAHFFVVSQHMAAGNVGTVVSFRNIIYSLIPENL